MPAAAPRTDLASPPARERVAVLGGGLSGLTAAFLLSRRHDVTLVEAEPHLGGGARTHTVPGPTGPLRLDLGAVAHPERTPPLLRRLLAELDLPTTSHAMSVGVRDEASGVEWAHGAGLRGVVARPRQLLRRDYVQMLAAARRFHDLARTVLAATDDRDETAYGELLKTTGLPPAATRWYAVPLVACGWPQGGGDPRGYPARHVVRFLDHHGLLAVDDPPRWLTLTGGSGALVDALAARVGAVRTGQPVTGVRRHESGVEVTVGGRAERYDRVVVALPADLALAVLEDPSPKEREVLGAFRSSQVETVLHRWPGLMPRSRLARGTWNCLLADDPGRPPRVTVSMNRLLGLPASTPLYLTCGDDGSVPPQHVVTTVRRAQPVVDHAAVRAQRRLPELASARTAYAGGHHGWGLAEDSVGAGASAAASLGVAW